MFNTAIQTGSFDGIGTDERIVVVPGLESAPYVAIDAHDSEDVVSVELTNEKAVQLAAALIRSATVDKPEGVIMATAITRITEAAQVARNLGFEDFADQLEALITLPMLAPETLDVLFALTGAKN